MRSEGRADGATGMTAQADGDLWTPVCELDKLPVERGVTALVRGHAVAVFLVPDGTVYAIGNHDPFSRATVLGRGIVGTRGDVPFVASPSSRRTFDLRTGSCLDDPLGERAGVRRPDPRRRRARRTPERRMITPRNRFLRSLRSLRSRFRGDPA